MDIEDNCGDIENTGSIEKGCWKASIAPCCIGCMSTICISAIIAVFIYGIYIGIKK